MSNTQPSDDFHWKTLERKTIWDSKFMKVYSDRVQIPNGSIVEGYMLVQKSDSVIVVATTPENHVVTLNEYKYAVDNILRVLPTGRIESTEEPTQAGLRELIEETGYSSNRYKYLGILRDFPSQDLQKIYIVRVWDVVKSFDIKYETTEHIEVKITPVEKIKEEIAAGQWIASSSLAALIRSGVLS